VIWDLLDELCIRCTSKLEALLKLEASLKWNVATTHSTGPLHFVGLRKNLKPWRSSFRYIEAQNVDKGDDTKGSWRLAAPDSEAGGYSLKNTFDSGRDRCYFQNGLSAER